MVKDLVRGRDRPARARDLAVKLTSVKDDRTRPGLFVVLVAEIEPRSEVHFWYFPGDDTFAARFLENTGRMVLEVVANAFRADAGEFKAARFIGPTRANRGFAQGVIEDRQARYSGAVSAAYWVQDFLEAHLALTAQDGTAHVAKTLNRLWQRSRGDVGRTSALARAALALLNRADEEVSFADIGQTLPPAERKGFDVLIERQYDLDQSFRLSKTVLLHDMAYRVVELNTGVTLMAPFVRFNQLLHPEQQSNGLVAFRTEGRVEQERLRARTRRSDRNGHQQERRRS